MIITVVEYASKDGIWTQAVVHDADGTIRGAWGGDERANPGPDEELKDFLNGFTSAEIRRPFRAPVKETGCGECGAIVYIVVTDEDAKTQGKVTMAGTCEHHAGPDGRTLR